MSYEMNDLLELMVDQGASDLHIQVNQPPTLRISGTMVPVEGPKLSAEDTEGLMKATTSISQLIRENKTYRIASDIQTGASRGMISLDAHLLSLFNRNLISADEALSKSQNAESMRAKLIENGASFPV